MPRTRGTAAGPGRPSLYGGRGLPQGYGRGCGAELRCHRRQRGRHGGSQCTGRSQGPRHGRRRSGRRRGGNRRCRCRCLLPRHAFGVPARYGRRCRTGIGGTGRRPPERGGPLDRGLLPAGTGGALVAPDAVGARPSGPRTRTRTRPRPCPRTGPHGRALHGRRGTRAGGQGRGGVQGSRRGLRERGGTRGRGRHGRAEQRPATCAGGSGVPDGRGGGGRRGCRGSSGSRGCRRGGRACAGTAGARAPGDRQGTSLDGRRRGRRPGQGRGPVDRGGDGGDRGARGAGDGEGDGRALHRRQVRTVAGVTGAVLAGRRARRVGSRDGQGERGQFESRRGLCRGGEDALDQPAGRAVEHGVGERAREGRVLPGAQPAAESGVGDGPRRPGGGPLDRRQPGPGGGPHHGRATAAVTRVGGSRGHEGRPRGRPRGLLRCTRDRARVRT